MTPTNYFNVCNLKPNLTYSEDLLTRHFYLYFACSQNLDEKVTDAQTPLTVKVKQATKYIGNQSTVILSILNISKICKYFFSKLFSFKEEDI